MHNVNRVISRAIEKCGHRDLKRNQEVADRSWSKWSLTSKMMRNRTVFLMYLIYVIFCKNLYTEGIFLENIFM